MPFYPAVSGQAYGFGEGDAVAEPVAPTSTEVADAASFYNPVVAGAQYLMRNTFEPEEGFSASEFGRDTPLWNDHYEKLGLAASSAEFSAIEGRINSENESRKVLDAAGGWGLAAEIVSGALSPTVFIPLVGQAKGAKGVAQVLAYAGAAASLDEIALLQTRETYTGGEAALGIAAGTVLGGMLGNASRYMTAREQRLITSDLERFTQTNTGMATLESNTAIHYLTPQGSSHITERVVFDKISTMSEETVAKLDPQDVKILQDIESGKIKVINESTGLRLEHVAEQLNMPRTSAASYLESPNAVSAFLNRQLGKLNPVTRTVNQSYSAAARHLTFQMSDAGLRGSGNRAGIATASEGNMESRLGEYQGFLGDFVQDLGNAFSRHIEGDRLPADQLQGEIRARIKAVANLPTGKMSSEQFNQEAFRVAQTGEETADPTITLAVKAWEKFEANFTEYAEEAYQFRLAQDSTTKRLFDPDGDLGPGLQNHVNHVFSDDAIRANVGGFIKMLTDNAETQSQAGFKRGVEKYQKKLGQLDELANLLAMTPAEGRAAYAQIDGDIAALTNTAEYATYRDERLALGKELREAKEAGAPDYELAEISAELKALKKSSPEVEAMLDKETALKRQRRALTQTAGKFEDTELELLGKIEALEVQDLNALGSVLVAGGKLAKALDKVSDKSLDAAIGKMWKNVAASLKKVTTQEKRMASLYKKTLTPAETFTAYHKMSVLSKTRTDADAKAEGLLTRIENAEGLDRDMQRELLRAVQDLNNVRVRDMNARRAVREEKLAEQLEDYSPDVVEARLEATEIAIAKLGDDFRAKWSAKGADDIDLDEGTANFRANSEATGTKLAEDIQGMHNPIAGLEILGGERGSELARVLNIPLAIKSEFLEQDLEKLTRIYTRHMGPDIEMYRATGSVNAAPSLAKVKREFTELRRFLQASPDRPKSPKEHAQWIKGELDIASAKETIPFTDAEKSLALVAANDAQKVVETDLDVMIRRIRNQRGIPDNPEGMMYRLGRVAKDMNVSRFMGSVLPSSVADVGRPVMRYGLQKTLMQGWGGYAKGMKRIQMTRRESRRAGVAWDPLLQNRFQKAMDVMDDYASRKSMPERATGFIADKTGFVAGFNRWTAEMKLVTTNVVLSELSEGFARTAGKNGEDPSWYISFLAEHGIEPPMAKRIWDQYLLEDGSELFEDGFRLPNTANWEDVGAKRAMRAAVNRAVDSTIITPGIDLPNWTDENLAFSMLAQFKSFTFASTNRTLLSGAQQADMALVNGMAISLAMGGVSYYLWAMSIGGDHLKEANKFDQGQWADEMISRSGLLGVFAEPYEIAQKIPATQNLVTFADKATTRRRSTGLAGSVLGPSFDLLEKASALAMGIDQPTASTLHQARLMGPYQNVFWFRRAIDNVEEGVASLLNLPDRRN